MSRTKSIVLYVGIALFTLGLGAFAFWSEESEQKEAVGPSKALARALEANDASAAPEGTRDYLKGVRGYFGRVKEARFLEAHTHRVGEGNQATTSIVSELFLRTKRGAAVVELDFESATSPFSKEDKITGIEELEPGDIRTDLSDRDAAAVKQGFEARGGKAADGLVLDGTFTADGKIREDKPTSRAKAPRTKLPPPREPKEVQRQRDQALERLRCVQRANGDVTKLQRCQ